MATTITAAAMLENEEVMRKFAQFMPQRIWTTTPDGLCDFLNDKWLEYTGLTFEDAIHWGWKKVVHPDDLAMFLPLWRETTRNASDIECELRLMHHESGEYRWNLIRGEVYRDNDGNALKYFGICTDVHDMKMAQAKTSASERHLSLIAKNIPAIVWLTDAQGNPEFMSNQWFNYTGVEWQSAAASLKEAVHPADLTLCTSAWQKALLAQTSTEFELRLKRAVDQKYSWNAARIEPIKDEQTGTVIAWLGIVIDVNAQKEAETILQLVIDNIPGTIWWKDRESRYVGSNLNNVHRAGLEKREDIIGKTDHELPWKDQADHYRTVDLRVMETNTPEFHIIERQQLADGRLAWLDTSKVPMHDADGNIIGTVGNFVDISELVKLTEQREDFMASLAHDLKIPIVGALRALEGLGAGLLGTLSPEQSDFIKKLHRSHQHLLQLIQNLLQVLRYEASADELFCTELNLETVATYCLNDLDSIALSKNIKIEQDITACISAVADQTAMSRLLMNLIGNALKFTPDGGSVKISIKEDHSNKENIRLEVTDTGHGINKEDQKLLFQRFWQGGSVKKYAAETGLGLYLCRQIAEGHGGEIKVESEEGNGSTFIVTFPRNGPHTRIQLRLDS